MTPQGREAGIFKEIWNKTHRSVKLVFSDQVEIGGQSEK